MNTFRLFSTRVGTLVCLVKAADREITKQNCTGVVLFLYRKYSGNMSRNTERCLFALENEQPYVQSVTPRKSIRPKLGSSWIFYGHLSTRSTVVHFCAVRRYNETATRADTLFITYCTKWLFLPYRLACCQCLAYYKFLMVLYFVDKIAIVTFATVHSHRYYELVYSPNKAEIQTETDYIQKNNTV